MHLFSQFVTSVIVILGPLVPLNPFFILISGQNPLRDDQRTQPFDRQGFTLLEHEVVTLLWTNLVFERDLSSLEVEQYQPVLAVAHDDTHALGV